MHPKTWWFLFTTLSAMNATYCVIAIMENRLGGAIFDGLMSAWMLWSAAKVAKEAETKRD
jgi:tryptophan-rich sensory protein